MPWFDLPEAELRTYRTDTVEPDGLDAWWAARLGEAQSAARETTLTRYKPEVYGDTEVYDVEFSGARGDRVRAWYLRPAGAGDGPHPVLVTYIGYGGGRSLPLDHLVWPGVGIATLVMDTRGQGGRWSVGATPDGEGTSSERSEVMTRGIASPETYYYTRLYVDAARAVEVAKGLPGADPSRIGVTGGSQGGALSLAAAALKPADVRVCAADVPFLCDIQRGITLTAATPYREVADFLAVNAALVDAARNTLRYVDNALLASRITADTYVSVGLMDEICPPSTVFAAYNAVGAPKQIEVNPFGVHQHSRVHDEVKVAFVRERLLAGR
ncbi:cephalosporin-C deacetylase [Motilibacter peucedani]|uniref:Cephalosporin-C deacetylase n=1 Tax=Motilibacter peucedani TaxID=598650 RepID=A0A420XNU8_9ACTN|nr:acetylxylan esterase [Motilibacter peucedani]RKS73871.1 cephalosporin-C deacetylase [Motilibacter peucedani]